MKIELHSITIRELVEGFCDNNEEGVVGYGGMLDIRPKYQREFVYDDKKRDAVIETVRHGFPLNVMYWVKKDDGGFELLDGQQRTISICHYVEGRGGGQGRFSIKDIYFHNLADDEKEQILDYKLMVYICTGTDSEKLKWFQTINIAGEKLTEQELRNAVYSGPWVSDAKRYFSKNGCVAYKIGCDFLNGSAIRQEYLETAISWLSNNQIEAYMATHQHDANALALWNYFQSVITWAEGITGKKHKKILKGVNWGELYNRYKDTVLDANKIDAEARQLLLDDDVTKKGGIYPYILTRDERHLSIRAFTDGQKLKVYTRQNGVCPICGERFQIEQMEADHITPWCEGGKTIEENCQMLCKSCNRRKSSK